MTYHCLSFYHRGLVRHLLTPGSLQVLPNQASCFLQPFTPQTVLITASASLSIWRSGHMGPPLGALQGLHIRVKPRPLRWPRNALHDLLAPNAFASRSPFPPALPFPRLLATLASLPVFEHSRHHFSLARSQISLYLAPLLPSGLS